MNAHTGTPMYTCLKLAINPNFPRHVMAPAHSEVTLTPKVDVYSYGIMLCEVATRTFPEAQKFPSMLEQVSTKWL